MGCRCRFSFSISHDLGCLLLLLLLLSYLLGSSYAFYDLIYLVFFFLRPFFLHTLHLFVEHVQTISVVLLLSFPGYPFTPKDGQLGRLVEKGSDFGLEPLACRERFLSHRSTDLCLNHSSTPMSRMTWRSASTF